MSVAFAAQRVCPRDLAPLERSMVRRPFPTLVDRCARCHGLFASAGDVHAAAGGLDPRSFPLLRGPDTGAAPCPACSSILEPREAPRTRVDVCPGCDGAWVASGRLTDLSSDTYVILTPEVPASLQGFAPLSGGERFAPLPAVEGHGHASSEEAPLAPGEGTSGRRRWWRRRTP